MGWFRRAPVEERYSFQDWLETFTFNGTGYVVMPQQTLTGTTEDIGAGFTGLVAGAYQSNGVLFACMFVRQLLFSEARFQFQRMKRGRPGDLYGVPALSILEEPWPNGTTGDLLTRMEQDGSLAGNAFVHRSSATRLERLRPDWVTIVIGSRNPDARVWDLGTEPVAYIYEPGGRSSGRDPVVIDAADVAHFAPIPDPVSPFRGMSWLQPILTELTADSAATAHKKAFFNNGATVNQAIVLDPTVTREMFEFFQDKFLTEHRGVANAYKTLFLGGGADVKTIGSDMRQIEFKQTQGAGETRIAAAAGVPPVIVGLSEGLQAATYSNYGQARRRFADGTMRPLWRSAAAALSHIVPAPEGSRLWYDARDIAFLAEDEKDAADIQSVNANAIRTLVDAGYEPSSVIDAVTSQDLSRLVHTNLFSVQLQPPGTVAAPEPEPAAGSNGNGTPAPALAAGGNGQAP